MYGEPAFKRQRNHYLDDAKYSFSLGDAEKAFDLLKKGEADDDVMCFFDVGFMLIKGIGCQANQLEGLNHLIQGKKRALEYPSGSWKNVGSSCCSFDDCEMVLDRLFSLATRLFQFLFFLLFFHRN